MTCDDEQTRRRLRSEHSDRRHAVETAIDLCKEFPFASWERIAEEAAKRGVRPWTEGGIGSGASRD